MYVYMVKKIHSVYYFSTDKALGTTRTPPQSANQRKRRYNFFSVSDTWLPLVLTIMTYKSLS